MSKTLLTTADVPKYIREIAQQLRPTTEPACDVGGVWGYHFRLYGRHKIGYENQLESDCEKLLDWCRRHYAEAEVVVKKFWWDQVSSVPGFQSTKSLRQKAYRNGVRNYIIVSITDPVAHRFEKDGFYRGQNKSKSYTNPYLERATQRLAAVPSNLM